VALIKAAIVSSSFMHLDREPLPIRFVAGLNVAVGAFARLGHRGGRGHAHPVD